ncbi:MAG: hypothetical protein AAGD05_09415, partial [Bacteroidota bacterium]
MIRNLSLLFVLSLVFACKSTQQAHTLQLAPNKQILMLDSMQAAQTIIIDESEHFFDYINKTDMSIQMKQNFPANTSREAALKAYQNYLQKDVLSFTPSEKVFLEKVFKEVYTNTMALAPDLLTDQIKLIKTHGQHYGPTTYYTRDNCIV